MIRSTTPTLQGREITEYLGIVVVEAILGANIFKDIFGAIRDIVGGRAGAYEEEMGRKKETVDRKRVETVLYRYRAHVLQTAPT